MTEFEYSYKNCHTDFDWERAAYYIYTEFHWLPQQFLLHYGKDGLHLIEDVTPYDEVYGRRHIDEFFFDKELRWKKRSMLSWIDNSGLVIEPEHAEVDFNHPIEADGLGWTGYGFPWQSDVDWQYDDGLDNEFTSHGPGPGDKENPGDTPSS
jgi:hypothetical protein